MTRGMRMQLLSFSAFDSCPREEDIESMCSAVSRAEQSEGAQREVPVIASDTEMKSDTPPHVRPGTRENIHGALERWRKRSRMKQLKWDVFISYRVDADLELVKEIYWPLVSTEVTVDGKTRRLRVFWDRECLKPGERWEDGFAQAICSTAVVVVVMSRHAYKMEGKKHNLESLTEDSQCDNVLLEYALALHLHEIKGSAIMPLFVGDKDESGSYSHFFQSGCMPVSPEVTVHSINDRVSHYLQILKDNAGVGPKNLSEALTIKQIMDSITEFQGFFLQGPAYQATKGAVHRIFECAESSLQQHEGKQELHKFQFSTPQGEEVYVFLANKALSCYAPILAKNKINSLRELSGLTSNQLDALHAEFCASLKTGDGTSTVHVGRRVRLGEVVSSLQHDSRTKTLTQQLHDFSDPTVSGINLLSARNQLEVLLAKRKWLLIMLLCLWFYIFANLRTLVHQLTARQQGPSAGPVSDFTVQLSTNGSIWFDVVCKDEHGRPCFYQNSGTMQITTSLFPDIQHARYVRVHTEEPIDGGDMRLGIMGSVGHNNLAFRVINNGPSGKVWLQHGCTRKTSPNKREAAPPGLWASPDLKIGQVQCCLSTASVCTRDGCLGGRENTTFFEAKKLCESSGWRLCESWEINQPGSSGCCDSLAPCSHYNTEMVWTSTTGGLQKQDTPGQLFSESALNRVKQVTVDLGAVQVVRGVKMQGGVPQTTLTPHCLADLFLWPSILIPVSIGFSLALWKSPSIAWKRGVLPGFLWMSLYSIVYAATAALDPAVPSLNSYNYVCQTAFRESCGAGESQGSGVPLVSCKSLHYPRLWVPSVLYVGVLAFVLPLLVHFVDQQFFLLGIILSIVSASVTRFYVNDVTFASFLLAIMIGLLVFLKVLQWKALRDARRQMEDDVKRYETAFGEACGASSHKGWTLTRRVHPDALGGSRDTTSSGHLNSIQEKCLQASSDIERGKAETIRKAPWFKRLCFWMCASAIGPYSKTGKIRQRTKNIDSLFDEAANANDAILELLESMVNEIGDVCRGPVKRPARALQKVVRIYYRDPRCLTDIVRCCVLLDSIEHVWRALEKLLNASVAFSDPGTEQVEHVNLLDRSSEAYFKLCKVKDRFTTKDQIGYRDICLNLEVGWTNESEATAELEFVTVDHFGKKHVRTHIFEVQLILRSMYELKVSGCHDTYVAARNMLSQ